MPAKTSNIVLHLEPETLDSGFTDGQRINSWNDTSGNDHHFTQASDDDRPVYQANLVNGLGGAFFNSSQLIGDHGDLRFDPRSDHFCVFALIMVDEPVPPYYTRYRTEDNTTVALDQPGQGTSSNFFPFLMWRRDNSALIPGYSLHSAHGLMGVHGANLAITHGTQFGNIITNRHLALVRIENRPTSWHMWRWLIGSRLTLTGVVMEAVADRTSITADASGTLPDSSDPVRIGALEDEFWAGVGTPLTKRGHLIELLVYDISAASTPNLEIADFQAIHAHFKAKYHDALSSSGTIDLSSYRPGTFLFDWTPLWRRTGLFREEDDRLELKTEELDDAAHVHLYKFDHGAVLDDLSIAGTFKTNFIGPQGAVLGARINHPDYTPPPDVNGLIDSQARDMLNGWPVSRAGVFVRLAHGTQQTAQIVQVSSGSTTILAQTPFEWVFDREYRIQFQLDGSNARLRLWEAGTAKPSPWTLETDAVTLLQEGFFGLALWQTGTLTFGDFSWVEGTATLAEPPPDPPDDVLDLYGVTNIIVDGQNTRLDWVWNEVADADGYEFEFREKGTTALLDERDVTESDADIVSDDAADPDIELIPAGYIRTKTTGLVQGRVYEARVRPFSEAGAERFVGAWTDWASMHTIYADAIPGWTYDEPSVVTAPINSLIPKDQT